VTGLTSKHQPRLWARVFVLTGVALLSGCIVGDISEVQTFIQQTKAKPGGRIEPVPEIKTYPSHIYDVDNLRSPFQPEVKGDVDNNTGGSGKAPISGRIKEALEAFPLDGLKLGGHVEKDGESWAVITAPDGLVYRVQVGNYMGQNHGRIHTITEDRIELTELVPGPNGGWVEREASLALEE